VHDAERRAVGAGALVDVRQRAIQLGIRIGWPEATAIAIEMAQALAHVHERSGPDGAPLGIVHRDLSPQNVMVSYAGEVKVIDFGTARGHNRRCHTVAGVVFAKPGYVAPEVARQQVGDARIDLYALGIMLWELCAARRFLTGDAQRHLEDAAAGKVVVPGLAAYSSAPPLLDEIIQKLTANDPDERYASAARAVPDLARVMTMAPSATGERGVRARIAALMRTLWPHEPGKSRAEFAKLLKEARAMCSAAESTPNASKVAEAISSRMAPEDPNALAGTPYRLARKIGEGASGVVYEAEHVELGRKVALKLLAPEHAAATDAIDRFRREARAIARLSHPNLVSLYDFGKSLDGRVFLAMELLDGETLDRQLKSRDRVPWREAVSLGIEVCRALEAAHGAALVHRDLKPANLFVTKAGPVKLLDFGIAMALAETAMADGERRQKGFAIFGTPEYMAPEQVAGEAVDGRCDLYSLGCVLYEMLTGARVFEGTSNVVVLGKQLRETPEAPRLRAPLREIPADVEAIVMRALAKKPDARFENATTMRAALEDSLAAPGKRRTRARRVVLASVTAALMIVAAGVTARWTARLAPSPAAVEALAAATATTAPAPAPTPTPTAPSAPPPTALASATSIASAPQSVASATASSLPLPFEAPQATTESRAERAHALAEARGKARTHMSDSRALKAWAVAAYRAGELREARRAANAWTLHDGTAEPRLFLATVLDASGRRVEAKAVLDEWLQTHPDSAEARALLAHVTGESTLAKR
jgi:serine/threonine-protein kinase